MPTLPVEPLRRAAFAPFGDVIEVTGASHYPINDGTTERFHDLAQLDVAAAAGRPLVNIFRTRPAPPPIRLKLMERHPLASQAFVPSAALISWSWWRRPARCSSRPACALSGRPADRG